MKFEEAVNQQLCKISSTLDKIRMLTETKEKRDTDIVFITVPEDGGTRSFSVGTTKIDFRTGVIQNPDGTLEYINTKLNTYKLEWLHSLSVDTNHDIIIKFEGKPKRTIASDFLAQIPWLTYYTLEVTCTVVTNIQIFACTNPSAVIGSFGKLVFTSSDRFLFSTDPIASIASNMNALTLASGIAKEFNDKYASDDIAALFNEDNYTAAQAAYVCDNSLFIAANVASVFNESALAAAKAANIINDAGLTTSKISSILASANITSAKISSIFNTGLLSVDVKRATVLDGAQYLAATAATDVNAATYTVDQKALAFDNTALTAARAASITGSENLTVVNAALIFGNANLSVSKALSIFTHANLTADRAQAILYQMIADGYYDKVLAIMTSDASNSTISVNGNFPASINRYNTLTVNAAIEFRGNVLPNVLIADTISNAGIIKVTAAKGGAGAGGAAGAGQGGEGRGGLIILARTLTVGTIVSNGGPAQNGTTVATAGTGNNGTGGLFWRIGSEVVPTGGNGGFSGSQTGFGSQNAGGGGDYNTAGNGGAATIIDYATGAALLNELIKTATDWWLQNVLSKTPTSPKTFPNLGGSGGGGGNATDTICAGGGGGGGAGQIIAAATTTLTAGTIQAIAGNGGNGGTEGGGDNGGGGGAGGVVYVLYAAKTGTNTITLTGGTKGTSDNTAAQDGAAGISQEIVI